MTLDYIKHQFLEIKDVPGILQSYLLDGEAKIVAHTLQKSERFSVGTLVGTSKELQLYPNPDVVNRILKHGSGYLENKKNETILVYYQINSLGWYYLVEAKTKELITNEK